MIFKEGKANEPQQVYESKQSLQTQEGQEKN